MRVGTPGFNGERLTEAREGRGMNLTALAELTGLKVQSISQYEQGKQSPSPEALALLCERLNVPERFFLRPSNVWSVDGITNRSLSSATKTARTRARRRFGWLKEIVAYLGEYLEFPGLNLPTFNLPADSAQLTMQQIEEVAESCRSHWGLGMGPLKDVVLVLENSGVVVSRMLLGAETLDAFSQWDKAINTPFIVLGADKGSAVRSRFDAAHELAHLVLHRHLTDKQVNSPVLHKLIESQANRFAGAFLLPAKSFSREVWAPTLDGFLSLKKHWKTSVGMMISRCEQLEILSEVQTKRAWINLSRKGWRTEEPLDSTMESEQPRLLRRSFKMLIDEGIKTREEIVSELRMTPSDIEDLACLSKGTMSGITVMEPVSIKVKVPDRQESRVFNFPGPKT